MPDLSQLGFTDKLREKYEREEIDVSRLARVVQEHKELYTIQNADGEFHAEVTGSMRFTAESRADFPAVGDWVEATVFEGGQAVIHKLLPRFSLLERQSVGAHGEKQIIAANIDKAFIVQSIDRDFNLNRLERYFVLAHNGGISPVVLLNKTDLIKEDRHSQIRQQVKERMKVPRMFMTSVASGHGLDEISAYLKKGETYCFIGSSGVGKSSIINHLIGEEILGTKEISNSTSKGRHTTTHRELILLQNGSILIDTPGMREVGMTDGQAGIAMTFDEIHRLAEGCKFKNCSHIDEPGCKVLDAIDEGVLSFQEYENYKKLERQAEYFSATIAEKRKKDKAFGKMCREVQKNKKRNKY